VHAERTLGSQRVVTPDFTFRQTLQAKVKLQLAWLQEIDGERYAADIVREAYDVARQHVSHSREVLMQLREATPLVLVSNFYGNMETVLREFNLVGVFQHVVESAVVGIRKPDPRIFALGVTRLGLQAADVAVVGDSIDKDIVPAKQAGCKTVWLRGEQWTDEPVDEHIPDRVIDDLNELLVIKD
jgi:putative hydrolase of the HAD superfamily